MKRIIHLTIVSFFISCISSVEDNKEDNTITNKVYLSSEIKPESVDFEFVWGRSRCTTTRNFDLDQYVHEKRLKKIKRKGYSLRKSLIVDDSPEKTKDNFGNAIYINPFEGDKSDNELEYLSKYLKSISQVENVRIIEKRGWRNNTYPNS